VMEKRGALKVWTILLAILAFSLSLIGTFLVRSGVLTSVHSFATDPRRGIFILAILIAFIGGALALYAWRAPLLKQGGLFAPISREGALVLNNLFLTCACATVFVGTLYPLALEALTGEKISVGPPFFNATFGPLFVPLLLIMPFGPLLGWKRGDLLAASQRLIFAAGAAMAVVLAVLLFVSPAAVLATLGLGLAAWIGVGSLVEWSERVQLFRASFKDTLARARNLPRSAYGVTLAHLGVAVFVAGIAASAWESERIELVRPGDSVSIADYNLRLDKVEQVEGPNYTADRGTVTVTRKGAPVTVMYPEKRLFTVQQMPTTFTAIRTDLLSDLYVVLADGAGNATWTLRVYQKPLVPWIWLGCGVMAFGGLMSLSDRRWRVGAAVRRTRAAAGAAADD
jgi:cytochrome c-type biogenesis protein CcmF